jgi:hypothetical protein
VKFIKLPDLHIAEEYWQISENSPSGLIWIKSPAWGVKVGQIAGSLDKYGYWDVALKGITYKAHRLVYLLKHKKDPGNLEIDHINGKTDNENLRTATRSQNQHNRPKRNMKTVSKYKGVIWSKQSNKWKARIYVNKKCYWLGYFACEKAAAVAYNEAAVRLVGEFAVLNKIENERDDGCCRLKRE